MLQDFQAYLSAEKHVKDKYVPYYLKWVSDCYNYFNESIENRLPIDKKQVFLKYLSKNHEDWQVNQAEHAIRL